jgi:hypothetical protein
LPSSHLLGKNQWSPIRLRKKIINNMEIKKLVGMRMEPLLLS